MPAILTHYTFAKFEGVNPERKHFGALVLGSQGPDPFFFYGMLPWKKREGSKVVNTFGSGLHKRELQAVLGEFDHFFIVISKTTARAT